MVFAYVCTYSILLHIIKLLVILVFNKHIILHLYSKPEREVLY